VFLPLHAAPKENEPYASAVLLPGGVADPDGNTGYLRDGKGRVEAVDLEKGRTLWKSDAAALPLITRGRRLVAATAIKDKPDRFRLIVLDLAREGKKVAESQEIELSGYRKGMKGSVLATAYLDGDELLLKWTAIWTKKSAEFTPNEIPEFTSGLARVNLTTGKAAALGDKEKGSLRPPLRLGDKLTKQLKEITTTRRYFFNQNAWSKDPQFLIAGDRLGVVSREHLGETEKLSLQTWDVRTGDDHDTTPLLERAFGLRLCASDDGRYLFCQQAQPRREKEPVWWEVYGVRERKRVGKVSLDFDPRAPDPLGAGVSGGRAFSAVDRPEADGSGRVMVLTAFELKTGKELWHRPAGPVAHVLALDSR
jgi:hypothetical protein